MFIEDIKNDFYNVLLGNRVLLLVHYDVDAICTCRILQALFKSDNVSYTLVPVSGIAELKTAYEENHEEVKYVVLVNCGGTIDLVEILQPEEEVVFFIVDAHKPTDICNVYSDGQIRLINKDVDEDIPNFDDIFRDDEEEEEDRPESSGGGVEALEARVERRRERRAWEEGRNQLLFNYTQFSYYGKPSALVMLELSWLVSRCGWQELWCGSVAAVAARALHRRSATQALVDIEALHQRVSGRQHTAHSTVQVVLEKDACLPLYRTWSLEGALRHAPLLAPRLSLHARQGAQRLRQLLADMGFPLQQARQTYRSMDVELRRSLPSRLEEAAGRLRLPVPTHATFLLQRDHSPAVAALDDVFAVMGLIEHESLARGAGFQQALSSLDTSPGENEGRRAGTQAARAALEAVARIVNSTLAAKQLHLAGPFSYFIVQEGTPEARLVGGPLWLGVAARWVASAVSGGGVRPLVASAPAHAQPDTCLLLGIPPHYDTEPRNLFGAAFEQAAAKSGASVSLDYVDSSVITLPTAHRAQFLDALTALLA